LLKLDRSGQAALFAVFVLGLGLATASLGEPFVEPYGWIPLLAAVAVVVVAGEARSSVAWGAFAVRNLGLPAWVPAVAIPSIVLTAGYLAVWAFTGVQLGLGTTSLPVFAVVSIAVVALASVEAIGEELGWRGFLLPRLVHLGRVRAGLVSGLLWAAWHVPLIYIAAAYHGGASPLFMVPFTITIVAMSLIANELRVASGSSWPAVVFHGAHNGIWFQLSTLVVGNAGGADGLAGESGLVPLTLYVLVALWIVARRPAWRSGYGSATRLGDGSATRLGDGSATR
jgi:CAAX protease family protein